MFCLIGMRSRFIKIELVLKIVFDYAYKDYKIFLLEINVNTSKYSKTLKRSKCL